MDLAFKCTLEMFNMHGFQDVRVKGLHIEYNVHIKTKKLNPSHSHEGA